MWKKKTLLVPRTTFRDDNTDSVNLPNISNRIWAQERLFVCKMYDRRVRNIYNKLPYIPNFPPTAVTRKHKQNLLFFLSLFRRVPRSAKMGLDIRKNRTFQGKSFLRFADRIRL